MTSVSTRFLGQPRLTNPTFKGFTTRGCVDFPLRIANTTSAGAIQFGKTSWPKGASQEIDEWKLNRARVVKALEEDGLRYFRGGRIVPSGYDPSPTPAPVGAGGAAPYPSQFDDLLSVILKGLPRAMHPNMTFRTYFTHSCGRGFRISGRRNSPPATQGRAREWISSCRSRGQS